MMRPRFYEFCDAVFGVGRRCSSRDPRRQSQRGQCLPNHVSPIVLCFDFPVDPIELAEMVPRGRIRLVLTPNCVPSNHLADPTSAQMTVRGIRRPNRTPRCPQVSRRTAPPPARYLDAALAAAFFCCL